MSELAHQTVKAGAVQDGALRSPQSGALLSPTRESKPPVTHSSSHAEAHEQPSPPTHARPHGHDFGRVSVSAPGAGLVSQRGEAHEQEADSAAESVVRGAGVTRPLSAGAARPLIQREPMGQWPPKLDTTPSPTQGEDAKKKAAEETAKAAGEAFMNSEAGKRLKATLEKDAKPLVKALDTTAGKVAAGVIGTGVVATSFAANAASHPERQPFTGDLPEPTVFGVDLGDVPGRSKPGIVTPLGTIPLGKEPDTKKPDKLPPAPEMPFKPKKDAVGQKLEQQQQEQMVMNYVLSQQAKGRELPQSAPKGDKDTPADKQRKAQEAKNEAAKEQSKKAAQKKEDEVPWYVPPQDSRSYQQILRKEEGGGAAPENIPREVTEVSRAEGRPLDPRTRAFMESRFGHDFSHVRIHTDARASEAARAISAQAYTLGRDVVFRTGQYRPDTESGKKILAHELAHVVQQDGGAMGAVRAGHETAPAVSRPEESSEREASRASELIAGGSFAPPLQGARASASTVQRQPDEWAKVYGTHKARTPSYDKYKKDYGEIKSTTGDGGRGIPAPPEISMDLLKQMYPDMAKDVDDPKEQKRAGTDVKAAKYLKSLNQAFKIMKIDTVEAQANYLSHAFIESDQFRQFTETQGSTSSASGGSQKWEDNPKNVQRNMTYLKDTYVPRKVDVSPTKKKDTEKSAEMKLNVNPGGEKGDFEFIGRGPVQVTDKYNYAEVIAVIEVAAEQYEKEADALKKAGKDDAQAREFADLARSAAKDIKADPQQAANPKYTFLVSAAHMKRRHSDKSVGWASPGETWTGADSASSWVAGGVQTDAPQVKALKDKSAAYAKIYPLLLNEAEQKNPAAKAKLEMKEGVQARKFLKNWQAANKKAEKPKREMSAE